eukprot:XP_022271083.1 uncharacterized protein LOC111094542 [Canis lupus familiaris]
MLYRFPGGISSWLCPCHLVRVRVRVRVHVLAVGRSLLLRTALGHRCTCSCVGSRRSEGAFQPVPCHSVHHPLSDRPARPTLGSEPPGGAVGGARGHPPPSRATIQRRGRSHPPEEVLVREGSGPIRVGLWRREGLASRRCLQRFCAPGLCCRVPAPPVSSFSGRGTRFPSCRSATPCLCLLRRGWEEGSCRVRPCSLPGAVACKDCWGGGQSPWTAKGWLGCRPPACRPGHRIAASPSARCSLSYSGQVLQVFPRAHLTGLSCPSLRLLPREATPRHGHHHHPESSCPEGWAEPRPAGAVLGGHGKVTARSRQGQQASTGAWTEAVAEGVEKRGPRPWTRLVEQSGGRVEQSGVQGSLRVCGRSAPLQNGPQRRRGWWGIVGLRWPWRGRSKARGTKAWDAVMGRVWEEAGSLGFCQTAGPVS